MLGFSVTGMLPEGTSGVHASPTSLSTANAVYTPSTALLKGGMAPDDVLILTKVDSGQYLLRVCHLHM